MHSLAGRELFKLTRTRLFWVVCGAGTMHQRLRRRPRARVRLPVPAHVPRQRLRPRARRGRRARRCRGARKPCPARRPPLSPSVLLASAQGAPGAPQTRVCRAAPAERWRAAGWVWSQGLLGVDWDVVAVILANCSRLFSLGLPGASVLIGAFLRALRRIVRPRVASRRVARRPPSGLRLTLVTADARAHSLYCVRPPCRTPRGATA